MNWSFPHVSPWWCRGGTQQGCLLGTASAPQPAVGLILSAHASLPSVCQGVHGCERPSFSPRHAISETGFLTLQIYQQRKNLAFTLQDARSVVSKLEMILGAVIHVLLVFAYLIIFDVSTLTVGLHHPVQSPACPSTLHHRLAPVV